jgi:sulfatase modifying factor 1
MQPAEEARAADDPTAGCGGRARWKPRLGAALGAFAIDDIEVTVAELAACVEARACMKPEENGRYCNGLRKDRWNHPANCVSFDEAKSFCAWRGKRLPTEDEWEYAARGKNARPYPWGDGSPSNQLCWRHTGTCEVASFPSGSTPEGVHDMAGNVWEWTDSQYAKAAGVMSTRGGPLAAAYEDAYRAMSAYRVGMVSTTTMWDLGFRCAKAGQD